MVVIPGTTPMTAKQGAIVANPAGCSRRCPILSSRAIPGTYPGTAATTTMASWIAILAAVEASGEIRVRICGMEIVFP